MRKVGDSAVCAGVECLLAAFAGALRAVSTVHVGDGPLTAVAEDANNLDAVLGRRLRLGRRHAAY